MKLSPSTPVTPHTVRAAATRPAGTAQRASKTASRPKMARICYLCGAQGADEADLAPPRFQIGGKGIDDAQAGGADEHQGDQNEEDGGGDHGVAVAVDIAAPKPGSGYGPRRASPIQR
ncbi:MAG: hypothetical protein ACOX30_09195 [Dethiobacteria bacterium]